MTAFVAGNASPTVLLTGGDVSAIHNTWIFLVFQVFIWVLFTWVMQMGYRKVDAAKLRRGEAIIRETHRPRSRRRLLSRRRPHPLGQQRRQRAAMDVETRRTWRVTSWARPGSAPATQYFFCRGRDGSLSAGPGAARVWDAESGKELRCLPGAWPIHPVDFGPRERPGKSLDRPVRGRPAALVLLDVGIRTIKRRSIPCMVERGPSA